VGRQIIRSVHQNQTEIHLQLKPPHLGRLRMSLETVNDGMRISILTEHQSTREMLRAHTGELRTALMEQGVRLEKIDVQVAFNFEQSMANSNKDLKRFNKRRDPGFDMAQDVRKLENTMPLNRPGQAWRPDGNLHLIA
jgi:flagellar hook-length control protein FliK